MRKEETRETRRGEGKEKEPMRRQGRRHQINVRLMLLSAHSAAELRILDSGAGPGLDEKDFRRDFLCTSPVSHPRQPASPSASASVMKTFAHRHFADFLVRFFSES